MSCLLVISCAYLCPSLRGTVGYYILVPGVAVGFSWPLLRVVFNSDFVSWLVAYITQDNVKVSVLTIFGDWQSSEQCQGVFLDTVWWNTFRTVSIRVSCLDWLVAYIQDSVKVNVYCQGNVWWPTFRITVSRWMSWHCLVTNFHDRLWLCFRYYICFSNIYDYV